MPQITAITAESAALLREVTVGRTKFALSNVLASLAATPADKLDYKPTETGKSIRECVIHLLEGNEHVGHAYGIEINAAAGPTDPASLASRLETSVGKILDRINSFTTEELEGSVEFFGAPRPLSSFILATEWHLARHAGQIDYIQTLYGDMENHF